MQGGEQEASKSDPNKLMMDIKIATLNLCLGLQQKKNLVKQIIIDEQIDVLCMQETEINNFSLNLTLLFNIEAIRAKITLLNQAQSCSSTS